jgi:hypothetical protein
VPTASARTIHRLGWLISWMSGEYLLTWLRYPNGGTVVFLRTLHVTIIVVTGGIIFTELADPNTELSFSAWELRSLLASHVGWFGAVFAAVYALLYARFSSQWTYLAGVYNQIKATRQGQNSVVALV